MLGYAPILTHCMNFHLLSFILAQYVGLFTGGKKGPKAYGLAKPLPIGEVLSDVTLKRQWKLLKPIGSGGFGLIYLGQNSSQFILCTCELSLL